jgi:uncharacterized repeat protein (TIGR01451 family)
MKTLTSTIFLIGLPVAIAIAAPDIEVQKAVNNEFPTANEPVEFTVQANNIGDQSATGVTVVDQLPAEMAIPTGAAAFPSVGTYDPATGEWAIGDLDSGVDAILVVPAVVTEPMPPDCIVNSAQSNFADVLGDSNDEARAAIHQTGVERCVDLVVDFGISASALTVFPDCDSFDRYTGDASVTNHGPDTARNVVVSIGQNPVVGPNLRFDDPDCSNAAASDCNIDEIAAGETVTINVTSDLYQSYEDVLQTLLVSATTSDSDYDLSNNDPSVSDSAGGFSSCMDIDLGFGDIGGPACFVATAAYGSPLDSRLDTLRGFRDRFMMINAPGRALVRFYYRNSPPYADYIAKRNWLRAAVRGFLAPIVFAIEYPGWAAFLIIGLLSAVVTRRIRSPRANLPTSRLQ